MFIHNIDSSLFQSNETLLEEGRDHLLLLYNETLDYMRLLLTAFEAEEDVEEQCSQWSRAAQQIIAADSTTINVMTCTRAKIISYVTYLT